VTEDELVKYFQTLSNWGRWGADDQYGTLNYITSESRIRAAALVRQGEVVSLGRSFSPKAARGGASTFLHWMTRSGLDLPSEGKGSTGDWIGFPIHGLDYSHLDAPSHESWNGQLYNGRPAAKVTSAGATWASVEHAIAKIVTRSLFIDMPRIKDVGWLEPGYEVQPEEIEACLSSHGLSAESGDVLIVRTGRDQRVAEQGWFDPQHDGTGGLGAECLPWLHEKEISVVISDVASDPRPPHYPVLDMPIHGVGIVAMGLWLVDNANLERLSKYAVESGRIDAMLTIAPLELKRSTGSPVNPIAVF
jgi:kynurenine formamidase